MIAVGDRVLIVGLASLAKGEVMAISHISELPHIEGAPPPEVVAAILAEQGAGRVALVAFDAGLGTRHAFLAIEDTHGWRDLKGQRVGFHVLGK